MRDIVSVTRVAVGCTKLIRLVMWDLDEVSETLMRWIDDELDEVSEVDYDQVCEVGEADEGRWPGWGLWSLSLIWVFFCVMTDELDKVSNVGDSIHHREQNLWMEINDNWIWHQLQAHSTLHPHPMLSNWKQYLPYCCVSQLDKLVAI